MKLCDFIASTGLKIADIVLVDMANERLFYPMPDDIFTDEIEFKFTTKDVLEIEGDTVKACKQQDISLVIDLASELNRDTNGLYIINQSDKLHLFSYILVSKSDEGVITLSDLLAKRDIDKERLALSHADDFALGLLYNSLSPLGLYFYANETSLELPLNSNLKISAGAYQVNDYYLLVRAI